HNLLENSAEAYPDKIALIHEDVRATYAEINSSANQLAQWIINQNIPKGERALFIFENCLEYVISYYGILKSGLVAVPINTDIKPDGLRPLIDELEPKVIIASSRFER
ncbi:AMP-dependent synthetase, partial [Desulfobacteraceae bacterium SEEP-SAG9]